MTTADRAGWAGLVRFGPFFAVSPGGSDEPWRPIAELGRPEGLRRRTDAVAAALGAGLPDGHVVPARVAASVCQLGLCARLSAVALAASAVGLAVPTPGAWRYVDRLGGPFPVAVGFDDAGPPQSWPDLLLALVGPVAAATTRDFPLSPQVVWGNVASGLAGAARMITAADPRLRETVETLVAEALATRELRARLVDDGSGFLRRRSCCLIYRLSDGRSAICGDCVLAASDGVPTGT